jgi:hypothetical protein
MSRAARTIPGSQVVPGTQIAALGRQANQLDIFAADKSGAIQSYWKYSTLGWGQVTVMPAGSTVTTGAGVGVSGWWDHMDVVTTDTHGGLVWTNFEQYLGWFNPTSVPPSGGSSFTPGEPMQLIAPYRGRLNVLGWSQFGGVVSERIDLVKDSTLNYTGPDRALWRLSFQPRVALPGLQGPGLQGPRMRSSMSEDSHARTRIRVRGVGLRHLRRCV